MTIFCVCPTNGIIWNCIHEEPKEDQAELVHYALTLGDRNEPDQQQAYQLAYTKYHSINGSTKMKIAG